MSWETLLYAVFSLFQRFGLCHSKIEGTDPFLWEYCLWDLAASVYYCCYLFTFLSNRKFPQNNWRGQRDHENLREFWKKKVSIGCTLLEWVHLQKMSSQRPAAGGRKNTWCPENEDLDIFFDSYQFRVWKNYSRGIEKESTGKFRNESYLLPLFFKTERLSNLYFSIINKD